MRQIALDTETTGLSTEQGHRIIEIGCVELVNRRVTGETFHVYLDPEREVDPGALAVHGLSNEFLRDKPKFSDVLEALVKFVAGAELIIHNAPFDVGFLNYELSLHKHPKLLTDYCSVFDTLPFARQQHPGQKNSLDALCKRYEVDNSHRQLHGALLDADLLARIYLAMTGGQASLFADKEQANQEAASKVINMLSRNKPLPVVELSDDEKQAHLEYVELLKKNSGIDMWEES